MTRNTKKQDELYFVRSLAQSLGERWAIEPRERPDFLVRCPTGAFGLEVTSVFAGKTNANGGSEYKRKQKVIQDIIDKMRLQFECAEPNVSVRIEFVGDVADSLTSPVVNALLGMKLRDKPVLHREQCVLYQDDRALALYVTRLPDDHNRKRLNRPDWYPVSETIGGREKSGHILQERILEKSKNLENYRRNIASQPGLHSTASLDVRLLLVANHYWASGMVRPDTGVSYNSHGFSAVYFYPFPSPPTLLNWRD